MLKKQLDSHQVLLKLEHYCAWQERCESEVLAKMELLGVPTAKQNNLLKHLRDENYLNDARYAEQFATGKFRMKKWGRIKISNALSAKNVPEKLIDAALNLLDTEEYEKTLRELLKEKGKSLPAIKDRFQLNHKVSVYAIGKGYEPDMIWNILKEVKGRK